MCSATYEVAIRASVDHILGNKELLTDLNPTMKLVFQGIHGSIFQQICILYIPLEESVALGYQ
jgi:hypothetical protein